MTTDPLDRLAEFGQAGTKTCTACGNVLPLSYFAVESKAKDGRKCRCRSCMSVSAVEYRKTITREARSRYNRLYRESHRDHIREYQRKYRAQFRNKNLAGQRAQTAIASGLLIRPEKCSQCGVTGPVDAHHEDYAKALDVVWLCTQCHHDQHPQPFPARMERSAK